MILDPVGTALQIATIGCSLISAKLLTRKKTERWGYLFTLVSLPVYAVLEIWYAEWVYLCLTPVYVYLYYKCLKEHWKGNICRQLVKHSIDLCRQLLMGLQRINLKDYLKKKLVNMWPARVLKDCLKRKKIW